MKSLYLIVVFLFAILCQSQTPLTIESIANAYKLGKSGDYQKAAQQIAVLKSAVSPKDSLYNILLSTSVEINIKAYNYRAAIDDMEKLIVLMPAEEQSLLTNIARYSFYLDDVDKNITTNMRITKNYPENEIAYGNLANTYNYLKQYDKALNVLNSRPRAHFYVENLQYARAYFGLREYDKAKEYIEKYLSYKNTDKSRNIGVGPAGEYASHKLAAQIYKALGDRAKSCKSITLAAQLIIEQKVLENFASMPEKMKEQKIVKYNIAEAKEIELLKKEYCK